MSVIDPCVHCGESTVFGSGRFVNRIPADTTLEDGTTRSGYACAECLAIECETCGEPCDRDDMRYDMQDNLHCLECWDWLELRECDECSRVTDAGEFPDWINGKCEFCDPDILEHPENASRAVL